jgi:hypothetical protein
VKKQNQLRIGAAIAATVLFSASPALAQKVPWYGAWVDAETAAAQPEVRPEAIPMSAATARIDPEFPGGTRVEVPMPDTYGSSTWSGHTLGPCDAFVLNGGTAVNAGVDNSACSKVEPATDGYSTIGFPIHLPQGASIQSLRIYYYGNSTGVSISAGLWKANEGTTTLIKGASPAAYAGGSTYADFGSFAETVNNSPVGGSTYHFAAILEKAGTAVTRIHKVNVYYKLQISPAPATATFTDVPTSHWAFRYVEALAASGISGGCGGGNFCPDANVNRAQMAVFLADALGLHFNY